MSAVEGESGSVPTIALATAALRTKSRQHVWGQHMSRSIEIHPTEAQLRLVYNLIQGQVLSTEDAEFWGLNSSQWTALQRFANLCGDALGA